MKKKIVCLVVILLTMLPSIGLAAPYSSFMIDRDGHYRYAPTLYEPAYVLDVDASGVLDMYIAKNDHIYMARVGTSGAEVQELDEKGNFIRSIGIGQIKKANGVFVDNDFNVYVADPTANTVWMFNPAGELVRDYGKPTNPLFGKKATYVPLKVVVDQQKNLYVVSEGTVDGMVQLAEDGEFLGYFGSNTSTSSFLKTLQKWFYSSEMMMGMFIRNIPISMNNVAIDQEGLIYAITKGQTTEPLKKINVAGKNLFPEVLTELYDDVVDLSLESVTVDQYGNVFVISGVTGHVIMLDSLGQVVGIFGARNYIASEMGISITPVALGVNSKQQVIIADRGAGNLTVYTPTPLMESIFEGLALYRQGKYIDGEPIWRDVLKRNTSVALAYRAIGLSAFKQEKYEEALDYFYLANDKKNYSNAFWELRQQFLMNASTWIIVGIVALVVLRAVLKLINRKTQLFAPLHRWKAKLKNTFIYRQYRMAARVLRHPIDTLYDVRHDEQFHTGTAFLMVAAALALLLGYCYLGGFIFNDINVKNTWSFSPVRTVVTYVLAGLLFIVSNYLVASIRDGRGKLIHVFKGTAISLSPIVFLYIPFILLSNILTLQEVFVLNAIQTLIITWCGMNIFIMVMQIHDYEFGEAVTNLILTVVTMMIILVVLIIIYILAKEAVGFFGAIIEEVYRRVLL